jgi:IS5 family transposase
MGQKSFWDLEQHQQQLAEKKPILRELNRVIPWESFRTQLEQIHEKSRKSNAGRKPIDVILMFKLLILQQLYNISDEELEYQVKDRLSFMQFLGLGLEDSVPDATTVWLFRQRLQEHELVEVLFENFESYLKEQGYQAQGGQVMDATLVPVPKQRISKEERAQLEAGEIPVDWQENRHRLAQKDRDARWTKKHDVSYYGYKNHINIDVEHGFIRNYSVTDAAVHDSQQLTQILDADNQGDEVWGDSAYRSIAIEGLLAILSYISHIHERAYRNRPLSEEQKAEN